MAQKYRRLETTRDLSRLMTWYYATRKIAGKLRPLAWVTSGVPVEILGAMGVETAYPENYGALLGAQRATVRLSQVAEEHGFGPDLCSYARSHIGSVLDRRHAPQGGLPKPDLLVACNNICGTVLKWYQVLERLLHVPLFFLDAPYQHEPGLPEHAVGYVAAQLEEMIAWVTHHTGRRLRQSRLEETVALSNEAVAHWRRVREMCRARPSPLNAPDLFTTMAPIVVMRGTRAAVWYYQKLEAEVRGRVARGEGALLQPERYRLLWDNIAIWPYLFRFFHLFSSAGACFVVDTYTNAWSLSVDASEPLQGLARTYLSAWINQSLQARAAQMVEMVREYSVDGMVFHSNRSCKPYSLGQYDLLNIVSSETGVPGLVIEADMCDTRLYAEEPIKNRVQAFLDQLEAA